MKKRPSIAMLTALLAVVFAAGIGVYSSYIGMKIYQESSDNLFESFSQISKTFTLFVQRNWTVLGQWDGLLKNTGSDADAENIWPDVQGSKESWRYSDFYLLNEDSQYLTADGRKGSAGSISGVIQELYNEDGPIVSTYTASYGVPKIVFAMPLSRNITLDGVTYTGLAVSYDTDVVDDLVDGSMYSGQSDCYIVRTNGDIVLALEPQTELCKGLTNLYDIDAHAAPTPVILCGVVNAEKLGTSGLVLDYAEYLESLVSRSGETQVIQNDRKTMDSFHYNKQVEQFLHRAIAEDLFEVYYQPVYSLHQQRYVTLEALSRLRHPELGWISPDIFIRLAEKNHLITQITELQLRRVCRFLCENPALRASIANVKINLSPLDLIQSESGSHLVRILGEYGLPCSCFQFEITETVATEYSASLTRVAESLQAAGIGLCLDDFGSGYANLNTVMQLPFSVIKLDRSLLFHICTDKNAALFYQSIVSAFCRLGYRIVAEGVETQEEMELLRSWNVDMIQGYYFSRPLPPDDLLRLLTGSAETQAENQA